LAASGGYLLNDARDAAADRLHPTKRTRPVAAGQLPVAVAMTVGGALLLGALVVAALLDVALCRALAAYAAVTLAYSLLLRRVAGLDVLAVAAGFALRAIAGAVAIAVPVSAWIVVCTALGTAYVVLVKRSQERALLHEDAWAHRPAQVAYGERGAQQLARVMALVTVAAYAAYTLSAPNLPANHAMVVTVPLVAFGLWRYGVAAHRAPDRNADELLARDRPLLLTIAAFAITAFVVLTFAR
ncbi:MAG: UbiA family prenyltransferase, partial [Chloroflexota bacterium]